MKSARMFAIVLWTLPLAAVPHAAAQDVSVETPAPPPQPATEDQIKQMGGQLLMSLFDRIVQGKAKPPATPVPVEDVAEQPAVDAADVEAPQEPTANPADEPEAPQAAPSPAISYGKTRLRSAGVGSQQVSRLPKSR